MRSAEAMGQPGGLGVVAYAFLPLDCLPSSRTTGRWPITTIGDACRQQAQARMQAVSLYAPARLQRGQKAADLFASLVAKQQTAMAS
jgi:hypothetical protein